MTSASGGGRRSASIAISSCRSSSQALDASIASWTRWYSAMSFSLSASESSCGHLLVQLVEALQQRAGRRDGQLDVAEHVAGRIEPRVLREEADPRAFGGKRLAGEVLLDAGHDLQQRGLARAVQAEDADLGARQEGEVDPLQDLALRRDDLPQVDHGEDVLVRHGSGGVYNRGPRLISGASPTLKPIVPSRRFS